MPFPKSLKLLKSPRKIVKFTKAMHTRLYKEDQSSDHGHDTLENMMTLYHTHILLPNQCSSSLVQTIDAPVSLVWSMVRQFDKPEAYKSFVKKCVCLNGNVGIGSVREVTVVSGLPACTSIERLDWLDDDRYVMRFSMIGGDHRLLNYTSTTTLHWNERESGAKTVVIESYVVDVPMGSSKEDTCLFTDTIIRCNLKSLARMSEKMACNSN